MLHLIFTLNFGDLFLYPLLFDLNYSSSSNINIELRFNLYSKTADNDLFFLSTSLRIYSTCSSLIFLKTSFGYFCCLQEIPKIFCNDQRQSWFFFRTLKVSLFCIFEKHYYVFIIVRIVRKCISVYLFCLEMLCSLCSSVLSTSIFEQESLAE